MEGDGRVRAIGQADNEVGVRTAAEAEDSEPLTAERVMGMRDGHESQRLLGGRGSALGMCQPFGIGLYKKRCG